MREDERERHTHTHRERERERERDEHNGVAPGDGMQGELVTLPALHRCLEPMCEKVTGDVLLGCAG
jgi:hypothetical protein